MAWGSFESLRPGRSVTYSFADPGVYSYVCSLHVGMLGTVVVGDAAASDTADGNGDLPIRMAGAIESSTALDGLGGAGPWAAALLVAIVSLFGGVRLGRRARP
jgi:hypothetical protein